MPEIPPSPEQPPHAPGAGLVANGVRPELSIVLPIFNEEPVIDELHRRLGEFLSALGTTWEVIFVDDGSKDQSFPKLRALAEIEPRYRVVSFARNFGHQFAVTAGIDYARGHAVVVMDADLQDPPEVVAEMLDRFREGFDIVHAVRRNREKVAVFKRATAYLFYRLLLAMVGITVPVDAGDFRLMSRRVVLTLRALRETSRFVRGMVAWRSEEHTSELQSQFHLVCRLLLEKKKEEIVMKTGAYVIKLKSLSDVLTWRKSIALLAPFSMLTSYSFFVLYSLLLKVSELLRSS